MRILFLSNLYPPCGLGGMELRCAETVDRLRARGHICHVLTSRYGVQKGHSPEEGVTRALYLQAGIQYYRPIDFFARRQWQERANRRALRRTLDRFKPDIVMLWGMWNLSRTLPYWVERWMPGRVAYTVASYWLVEPDPHEAYWGHAGRRRWVRRLLAPTRWLALRMLKQDRTSHPLALEHVACVSEYVRQKLTEADAFPHGARVIYNGIDPQPFLNRAAQQALRDGEMCLIYTGSLLSHKGVHTAIEAMGLLSQQGVADDLYLTLVGDGRPDYEMHLRNRAAELGLSAHVAFLGRVSRDEIPDLLGGAHVFLFTSVWDEPIARSVMEAMASGLVVVGTAVGGQSEMLQDGVNALVFPPEDAEALASCILQLQRDPDLCIRLAEAGRRTVMNRFTLERMVDEIESWLESIAT